MMPINAVLCINIKNTKINNMSNIKWVTSKNLGIVEEDSYFQIQLMATGDASQISYTLISGNLPNGVNLSYSGMLFGTPRTIIGQQVFDSNFDFTVRVGDGYGTVADKTFSLMVSAVKSSSINDQFEYLGLFLDGDWFSHRIPLENFGQDKKLSWRIVDGRIPQGITVDQSGLLHGFLGNKITDQPKDSFGWDKSSWDAYFLDATRAQNDSVYQFTVELNDGIYQHRKSYKISILPRDYVTRADRTYFIPYDKMLEASQNGHLPRVVNDDIIPGITVELNRNDTNFSYKFQGEDLDKDDFYYEITSPDDGGFDQDGKVGFDTEVLDPSLYPMPRGIGLVNESGWYTGHIYKQREYRNDYKFQIYNGKTIGDGYLGPRSTFNITVLGSFLDNITWVTESDLGFIDNGSCSILRVLAVTKNNLELNYKLNPSTKSRLPQGLTLLPTGEISGRASFRYFTLDHNKTLFDGEKTTFDRHYKFDVVVKDRYNGLQNQRTFVIKINVNFTEPYDNLYLRALPPKNQRRYLRSIIESSYYFPEELLFRPSDPQWGKKSYLEFLFLQGLAPRDLSVYLKAVEKNHYTKILTFGDIKTAVALDNDYNIVYEVVYLDVNDPQLGIDSNTGIKKYPKQSIALANQINFYDVNGADQKVLEPNGLGNMKQQVLSQIPINSLVPLPQWMSCMQPDPNSISGFGPPIGHIPAVILAYTQPGASELIAYRLKSDNVLFNKIEFVVDRYLLDNVLSKYYDINTQSYIPGNNCLFDQKPSIAEIYRKKSNVTYAVTCEFSDLDGKNLTDVLDKYLFDADNTVASGDTLIFIQRKKYNKIQDYSIGWVDINGRVIPGYLDQILFDFANERSAVYTITISGGKVFLSLLNLTDAGDIVKIDKGFQFGGKELCFDSYIVRGQDPSWQIFTHSLILDPTTNLLMIKNRKPTTFDTDSTRFVSNRDKNYIDSNVEYKYIKFPKTGVFI
jgi:hypothetical protein